MNDRLTDEEIDLLKWLVKKYIFFINEDGEKIIRKLDNMKGAKKDD